ncbi:MAG: GTP-sensing pleiotropic transcriptional regulator CodY [Bacillota bacterium]|jgi:transcriptional pleiotropic repressor|nr:GTP-sensing pleiotropic transcriptional regulator CodY [Bacillota bacterium]HOC05839.1 GTP-sensing pleiotropic transcriptional regulator CodY [Bacillota bacterium]HPZ21711.1 GTP-sensing pleiotropic transcriptional regulator CodY [Bacillota bacterium]HQD19548.1 GTP-sensing pleiotropic transcriptional regulator CodY [Bacillota bacterium]
MQNLLQKTRRLNKFLQRSGGQTVALEDLVNILEELLESDVLLINDQGEVMANSPSLGEASDIDFPRDLSDTLLSLEGSLANLTEGTEDLFPGKFSLIVPVSGGNQRLGNLVLSRKNKYDIADLIIAELGATITGLGVLRAKEAILEEENRKRAVVKMALDTLSYSEQEAVEHIFNELDGKEGFLVASKIADKVGITRSVIVNALRKFESAGVIESRSLGMKGTFIRILNDQLLPELEKLRNR